MLLEKYVNRSEFKVRFSEVDFAVALEAWKLSINLRKITILQKEKRKVHWAFLKKR